MAINTLTKLGSVNIESGHNFISWSHDKVDTTAYEIERRYSLTDTYVLISTFTLNTFKKEQSSFYYDDREYDQNEYNVIYRVRAINATEQSNYLETSVDINEKPGFRYAITNYMKEMFDRSPDFDMFDVVFPAKQNMITLAEGWEKDIEGHNLPALFFSQGLNYTVGPAGLLTGEHNANKNESTGMCNPVITLIATHSDKPVIEKLVSKFEDRLMFLWGNNLRGGVKGTDFDRLGIENSGYPVNTFICEKYMSDRPREWRGDGNSDYYLRIDYIIPTSVYFNQATRYEFEVILADAMGEFEVSLESPQMLVTAYEESASGSMLVTAYEESASGSMLVTSYEESASGSMLVTSYEES